VTDAPTLSAHDVEGFLEDYYQGRRSVRSLIAVYGTGAAGEVIGEPFGRFEVVPVRSELELRRRMPPYDDQSARIVFLLPYPGELPLDLGGRFSDNGRIHSVGPDLRLRQLFGASELGPGVAQSALARMLLDSGAEPFGLGGGRLSVAQMWRAWLDRELGLADLALDALLAWAASRPAVAVDGEVREELLPYLVTAVDPAAPMVWRAWESGRGRAVLEAAVVFESLATSEGIGDDPAGRLWLRQKVRDLGGEDLDEAARIQAARSLGDATGGAIALLRKPLDPVDIRELYRAADAQIEDSEIRALVATSRRLPSAWQARIARLGEALERGAKKPGAAAVAVAREALEELERHDTFVDDDQKPTLARAENAVKLLAWLASGADPRRAPAKTPHGDVARLGGWYVADGGWVDRARRRARGRSVDALDVGIQAVLDEVDQARVELDRRFAAALVAWHGADRPGAATVPIDRALERVALRYLEGDESRRLLVLLLDGMAWAQTVEILEALHKLPDRWGPLSWHVSKTGRLADGHDLPPGGVIVVANLPTVTEVSRSAFFAGQTVQSGKDHKSEKDPARFAENKRLAKVAPKPPKLYLKGEASESDGAVARPLLSKIADRDDRLVAVVLNAIDASLKGDPQVQHAWTHETIGPLLPLLEAARDAGREVMLAADHGHVHADRLATVSVPAGSKPRWRPWRRGEAVADYEVVLDAEKAPAVWVPRGADGVVLLADDHHRYGGSAAAGEHGGATLAEVIAPCLLIGPERDGEALAPVVPTWWYYELEQQPTPVPVTPTRGRRKRVSENQLAIPGVVQPAGLGASELFLKRARSKDRSELALRAVAFLRDRSGRAGTTSFAAAMGTLPTRVGGLVSKVSEILNFDGFLVLSHDTKTDQVILDVPLLEQVFEVKL
jgi:hypothetical protein